MNAEEKLEELKAKGIPVYSFSRLSSFHNCEYEYYNTYILGKKGIDNVYTILGSTLHENIENVSLGKIDVDTFKKNYENKLIELEVLGINFPNETIKSRWIKDVEHFISNFTPMKGKMAIETLILFNLKGVWLHGYVDCIVPSEKGYPYVNVIDWKTSSKFSGKKLIEAGRQLIMYKLGIESTSNMKVDKLMWNMIKYVNVHIKQKNGKVKTKMCSRGKWVKEIKKQLEEKLYQLNMNDFEVELLIDKAVEENNLNCMPKAIQEQFWLEDCLVEYEATEDRIAEFEQYIINTVKEIESKSNDEMEWKAIEIDQTNSFYCGVLCPHRKNCKFYKAFLEENANNFKEKNNENEIDFNNLFG